jgi:hypothetical protein
LFVRKPKVALTPFGWYVLSRMYGINRAIRALEKIAVAGVPAQRVSAEDCPVTPPPTQAFDLQLRDCWGQEMEAGGHRAAVEPIKAELDQIRKAVDQ